MDQSQEEWKAVVGFEGFYEVSQMGNVRSLQRQIETSRGVRTLNARRMTPFANDKGYWKVAITKHGTEHWKCIHKLVAEAFLQNPLMLPEVDHIDGDKNNNGFSNLRWSSRLDNIRSAWNLGLYPSGAEINSAKLSEQQVREIRQLYSDHSTPVRTLAKLYGVGSSTIFRILHRTAWKRLH